MICTGIPFEKCGAGVERPSPDIASHAFLKGSSKNDIRRNENFHLPKLFGVKIEHGICVSVRRCRTVSTHKTGALNRVLRATGRYSMRRLGKIALSTTTSRSLLHLSLKVPEGKCVDAEYR